MPSDSRARLIAYLCQAGLSVARANAVLDVYTEEIAERVRGNDDTRTSPAERKLCGFLHDQWDGPYRMSRRCVAKAGHTTGQFAYDHGPWESVSNEVGP